MSQKKKLVYNIFFSLLLQFTAIICNFIVPRIMLKSYGSEVNGLISSITQFLGFVGIAECGFGAVVQSSLYKPLVEKDNNKLSQIIKSSQLFFRKIAILLLIYTIGLMIVYPRIIVSNFDSSYISTLILIISVSSFFQYLFGSTYALLLTADLNGFIHSISSIIITVLNTILIIVLVKLKYSIHMVKIGSSIIFLLHPLILNLYVKNNYKIDKNIKLIHEPISQKWNGFMQHIANIILENTDVAVLTIFTNLSIVSVYTVYNMVIIGLKKIIFSFSSGMQPIIGKIYAQNDQTKLNKCFSFFEWSMHNIVTFLFSCTIVLIIPFVSIYTRGVTDINYINYIFAIMIVLAGAFYAYRLPYNILILAIGHYKQTQMSAFIEALVNIVISVILARKYGLIGVAIGTLIAMIYRIIFFIFYIKNKVLERNYLSFTKIFIVDMIVIAISIIISKFNLFHCSSYSTWVIKSLIVAISFAIGLLIINYIFYKEYTNIMLKKVRDKFRRE